MSTLRFVLRIDHLDKAGRSPIEGLYQISGQRKYFRIDKKFKLYSANWQASKDKQEAVYLDRKAAKNVLPDKNYEDLPTSQEVGEINDKLDEVRKKIGKIEKRFELDGIPYDTGMIIDKYKNELAPMTKKEPRSNVLFDAIEEFIETKKEDSEAGSLIVYKTVVSHLKGFQKKKNVKITFENIDINFFEQFKSYLLSLKKENGDPMLYNATINKKLSTLKSLLNYAKDHGYDVNDSYTKFKIKKDKGEKKKKVIALTQDELDILLNLDLSKDKKLDQVRDVFCFSCATGLRYSDLAQLKREHISDDHFQITVKKTGDLLNIPLNPISDAILFKYKDCYKPLPVISNQKTNAYLKGYVDKRSGNPVSVPGLCELAGLDEKIEIVRFRGGKGFPTVYKKYQLIGVHSGRRTFITLSLEKGMGIEDVMAHSGHTDYNSFKKYVDITEKRKKTIMAQAWGALIRKDKLKAV